MYTFALLLLPQYAKGNSYEALNESSLLVQEKRNCFIH